MAGAPKGNRNAAKNKLWADAIRKAIAQSDPNKLRSIAEKLLSMAESGDLQAMREIGDRLDGRPSQEISGDFQINNPLDELGIDELTRLCEVLKPEQQGNFVRKRPRKAKPEDSEKQIH